MWDLRRLEDCHVTAHAEGISSPSAEPHFEGTPSCRKYQIVEPPLPTKNSSLFPPPLVFCQPDSVQRDTMKLSRDRVHMVFLRASAGDGTTARARYIRICLLPGIKSKALYESRVRLHQHLHVRPLLRKPILHRRQQQQLIDFRCLWG